MRDDLPHGVRAAQLIHAAGESAHLVDELPGDTHAIALGASQEELLELEARLRFEGIPHAAIREPDPPYSGELLAIGVAPLHRTTRLKRLMGSLRLVGKETP